MDTSFSAVEAAVRAGQDAEQETHKRSLAAAAWGAFIDAVAQKPLQSIAQLSDHTFGTDLARHVHIADAPQSCAFASKEWYAQQFGAGVGMIAPFMLVNEGMGRLLGTAGEAAKTAESVSFADYARAGMARARNLGLSGATYSLLFTPATGDSGDFWMNKTRNAGVSGITFAGMGAASSGLQGLGESLAGSSPVLSRALSNEIVSSGLSGIPGGFLSAELGSLSSGKGWSAGNEVLRQMFTYSILGAGFAAGHVGIERATARGASGSAGAAPASSGELATGTAAENTSSRMPDTAKYASDTTLSDGTRIIEHWDGKRVTITPGRKPLVELPDGRERSPQPSLQTQPESPPAVRAVVREQPQAPDYSHLPPEKQPFNVGSRFGSELEQDMSNFAHRPFTLDGKRYESVEGFYVSLKHSHDPVKAEQAASLWGAEAKKFGRSSKETTATYNGQTFELGSPEHHSLIKRAIRAKLEEHPELANAFAASHPRPIIHDLGYPESPTTRLPARDFARILTELRDELLH